MSYCDVCGLSSCYVRGGECSKSSWCPHPEDQQGGIWVDGKRWWVCKRCGKTLRVVDDSD